MAPSLPANEPLTAWGFPPLLMSSNIHLPAPLNGHAHMAPASGELGEPAHMVRQGHLHRFPKQRLPSTGTGRRDKCPPFPATRFGTVAVPALMGMTNQRGFQLPSLLFLATTTIIIMKSSRGL